MQEKNSNKVDYKNLSRYQKVTGYLKMRGSMTRIGGGQHIGPSDPFNNYGNKKVSKVWHGHRLSVQPPRRLLSQPIEVAPKQNKSQMNDVDAKLMQGHRNLRVQFPKFPR